MENKILMEVKERATNNAVNFLKVYYKDSIDLRPIEEVQAELLEKINSADEETFYWIYELVGYHGTLFEGYKDGQGSYFVDYDKEEQASAIEDLLEYLKIEF